MPENLLAGNVLFPYLSPYNYGKTGSSYCYGSERSCREMSDPSVVNSSQKELEATVLSARPWVKYYEPGVPIQLDIPDHPLTWLLDQAASRYPQRTALIYYGTKISYAQLSTLVKRFALALQRSISNRFLRHTQSWGDSSTNQPPLYRARNAASTGRLWRARACDAGYVLSCCTSSTRPDQSRANYYHQPRRLPSPCSARSLPTEPAASQAARAAPDPPGTAFGRHAAHHERDAGTAYKRRRRGIQPAGASRG